MTCVALLLLALGQDQSPWSKFREGAYVKYDVVERSGREETRFERKVLLAKVQKERLTIVTEDFDEEGKSLQKSEHVLAANGSLGLDAVRTERGTETVDVEGRKMECRVIEEKITSGARTTVRTQWRSAESPVGWVKEEIVVEQEKKKRSVTSVLVRLGDEIELSTGKLPCALFEVAGEMSDGTKFTRKDWRSPKVPGGLVKSVEKADDGSSARTVEVAEVRAP